MFTKVFFSNNVSCVRPYYRLAVAQLGEWWNSMLSLVRLRDPLFAIFRTISLNLSPLFFNGKKGVP